MSGGAYLAGATLEDRRNIEVHNAARTIYGGVSSHSGNDFTITTTIPIVTLLAGTIFRWIPDAANTGAPTLAVKNPAGTTTISATSIKAADGSTTLPANGILSNIPIDCWYDGTNFRALGYPALGSLNNSDGTYTPTLTNVTNLDASTAFTCQYSRNGSVVTVSGLVNVDPTAAAATELGISLPIASDFTANEDCGGMGGATGFQESCPILADPTNNRARMMWVATNTANNPRYFIFQYRIR